MRLVFLAALLSLAACKQQTYEELDAKSRAHDAEVKARIAQSKTSKQAADEAANRAASAEEKSNQAKADAARKAKEEGMETLRSVYTPMTPAQRESALRNICGRDDGCERMMRQAITTAAPTAQERAKLESIADRLVDENFTQRDYYVNDVILYFTKSGRHGFSVDDDGSGKKHLLITGSFCSDEFVQGFVGGEWGTKARDRGFERIDCGEWGRAL